MTAISNAFTQALKEAHAQSGGNGKGPVVVEALQTQMPDPTYSVLFCSARESARRTLSVAQVQHNRLDNAETLHALQRAQHCVEEVERQILTARDLVTLAQDMCDDVLRNARRVDSWTAAIGTRAEKLVRRVMQ